MGIKERLKGILTRRQEKHYVKQLAMRKVNYESWVKEQEKSALKDQGQMLLFNGGVHIWCAKAGKPHENAVAWIEEYFSQNPQIMIAYGDEDVLTGEQGRKNPWYKPDWSPDTYESCFYVGSVIAIRSTFVQELCEENILPFQTEDRQYFENACRMREWLDKAVRKAGGFKKGCNRIGRIPQILFHVTKESVWEEYLSCAMPKSDTAPSVPEAAELKQKLSVIIPSKDNPQLLEQCLKSLQESIEAQKDHVDIELIVVDNGSNSENRKALETLLQTHTYIYAPMEFNFARMCNMGAIAATGNVLLFLNDDIEFVKNQWLLKMLAKAVLPYVGAVGLKLYYPDSQMIQHSGVTCLPIGPVHKLQGFADDKQYYYGKNQFVQNCLAVTGACLMVEKVKFAEVGGFLDNLQVAYNDVDLCISLYEAGYQNMVVNSCFAYHHESLSRGNDESDEKQKRLQTEWAILQNRHPYFAVEDPFYPKQLNTQSLDARIVPGYHSAKNQAQTAAWKTGKKLLDKAREDACVMMRIEACNKTLLQGYSVVLGDNNACYDKYLLLKDAEGRLVSMALEGQYRMDLEENLPDQKNVALGGFCISNPAVNLRKGEYRIGILAVNRINRSRIFNWSNKQLKSD